MAFNILIVDDSGTMRAVVRKTVAISGVPVGEFHEAANGREALKILADEWIDVILSDINMPEMGGMELLKELRASDELKRTPVIFITTEASPARMEEARSLGVSGYVKKPFVPEQIREVLLDVLERAYDRKIELANPEVQAGDDEMDF